MNVINGKKNVEIHLPGDVTLFGDLQTLTRPLGIVLFAHGSGSSRFSPRNIAVANALHKANFATFLFDLLTREEEKIDEFTRQYRFNIPLLANRLSQVTDWFQEDSHLKNLGVNYFGASTGAAAALIAAAEQGKKIKAVVSRGGRPDLAGSSLPQVKSPTLLIVGELDTEVIELNKQAQSKLCVENALKIVPGATHLFEEPGTLEQVMALATDWFVRFA